MYKVTSIIWDWNGTLLNDTNLCISAMNILLKKRNLPFLNKKKYYEVFTFPVIEYYKKLGFDFNKEPFEIPAFEFIAEYHKQFNSTSLQPGVIEILDYFRSKKIKQFVLSAMEQESLEMTLRKFKLNDYFEEVTGIKDHFAYSKVEYGIDLIKRNNLNQQETFMIGDSIHDFEVAEELGIRCVLIANGHMPKERLKNSCSNIYRDLIDLKSNFNISIL